MPERLMQPSIPGFLRNKIIIPFTTVKFLAYSENNYLCRRIRDVSSVGLEHRLDRAGVVGSNPSHPTEENPVRKHGIFCLMLLPLAYMLTLRCRFFHFKELFINPSNPAKTWDYSSLTSSLITVGR